MVTFENYKDKEEVLRKGYMLKGSSIHITEDMNKKTRDSRMELRRFMKAVKRNNPSASCVLQYDKLYVDNKIFVYNDIQGKVVEHSIEEENLLYSRPPSSLTSNGSISPVSIYRDKVLNRTQSMFSVGEEEDMERVIKEKDETIIELKAIIEKMEQDMKRMNQELSMKSNHADSVGTFANVVEPIIEKPEEH